MKIFQSIERKVEIEIVFRDGISKQFAASAPTIAEMKQYDKNEKTLGGVDAVVKNLSNILGIEESEIINNLDWATASNIYKHYFEAIKELCQDIPPV